MTGLALRGQAVRTARLRRFTAGVLCWPLLAMAGNTWDGGSGTTDNWSDNTNWNLDTAPSYGTLAFVGTTRTTNTIDANYNMNQINWNNSSGWTLNNSGGATLTLFDNGGTQAKIENLGSGTVTINAPITFAATTGNNWGEINAVSGPLTFASNTLTVNGSGVNGIRMFSGGQTVNFDSTVSASGKYFATTSGSGATLNVGGSFTSGDLYLMNGSTLNLNSGGSISTSALRLGGDFGTTGSQNLALGATFAFNAAGGGQSFGNTINTVGSNTSGALLVDSKNTSGANTLSSGIFLDSNLRIQQASGGSLTVSGTTLDLKNQTLTLDGAGNIDVTGALSNSTGSGKLTKTGSGTTTLSAANTHSGDTIIQNGTLQFGQGGSAASSIVRVGNTSGSNAATLNISDADGGTTIGSTLVVRNGSSGTKTIGGTNTSGVNTYSGTVALDDAVTLSAASGGTTAFSGAISDGAGAGTFGLLVGGTGTVRFSGGGANSGVSQYTVGNGATLDLAKTAGVTAVDSTLTVNNGGTVQLTNANQISDTAAVTVDGTFNLNGQAETIGSLAGASSGAVQTGGAQLIAGQNNGSTTFAGVISGTGSLVKKGTGTLTLSGANTYSGDTYAVGGTTQFNAAPGAGFTGVLQVGETSGTDAATVAIGTGGVTIANDLTVRSGSSGVKTIAANNTTGTATFSGTTTLNDAVTLRAANGGALTMGAISQGANGLLVQAASGNTITLGGNLTGSGFLEKSAAFPGNVVLTGVKSSTGDLRINDGTFIIGAGGDVTAGNIFLGSNVHQLNTALELSVAGADIGQPVSVENAGGAETRTLSSTAASGTTTLSGALSLKKNLAVNANAGSALEISGPINLSAGGDNDLTIANSSAVTLSGAISAASGSADINKSGAGTLTVSADNTGSLYKLNLAGGVTHLTHANALGTAYSDKVNFLTANSELRVGASMAPASLGLTINNVTATVNTDSGVTFTVPGVVANAGGTSALTKAGAGTLVLAADNTYNGATTINAGTLQVGNGGTAGNLGTNSGSIANSGVLAFNRSNAYTLGNVVSGSGSVEQRGAGTLTLSGVNSFSGGLVIKSGVVNATTSTSALGGSGTGAVTLGDTSGSANASLVIGTAGTYNNPITVASGTSGNTLGLGSATGIAAVLGGTVTLNNTATRLSVAAGSSGSVNFANSIGGNGGLSIDSTGTVTLTGANSFQGGVVLNSGTLNLNNAAALGNTAGTFTINGGTINRTGGVTTLTTNNPVDINGDFTYSGSSQSINLGSGAATLGTSAGTSRSITVGGNTLTLGGVISDGTTANGITKLGAGTLALAGLNAYSGATTVNAGVLTVATLADGGVASGIGASPSAAANLVLGGGTLRYTGATVTSDRAFTLANGTSGTFDVSTGATTVTFSGNSAATSGSLVKIGSGTLALTGANAYTGVTTISAGTLSVASLANGGAASGIGASSSAAANLVLAGGNFRYTGATVSTDRGFTIGNATTGIFDVSTSGTTLTFSGNSAATSGALTKVGSGTLALTGSNAYTGITTLSAGTLSVSNLANGNANSAIGASPAGAANLVLAGGTLQYTGGTASTDRGFTLNTATTGTFDVSAGATTLTVSGNSAATSGALTKIGSGTLALTGSNAYTGITTINGGTLSVSTLANGGANSGIGASPAAAANLVLGGGNLQYTGGSTSIDRAFTLTNATNSGIDVSTGATTLTLSGVSAATSGALTKTGDGTLVLSGANLYTGGTTVKGGTLGFGVSAALGSGSVLLGDTTGSVNASLLAKGAFTLANNITVQSGSTGVATLGGDTAGTSTFGGNILLGSSGGTQRNLTLVAAAGGTAEFSGVFNENTSVPASNLSIGDATHSGTVRLTNGANAYSGVTSVGFGATLDATDLSSGNSSLGNSSTAAANLVLDNGTLKYSGAGESTARSFTIGTGGATLDASGASNAALVWSSTSALATSGTGTRTLTLTGASTGANSLSAIIPNDGANATSLAKTGPGTWALAGTAANTFTGSATVSGGILDLNKSAGVNAIAGDGNTGTNDILINGGTLRWQANEQMPSNASIGLSSGSVDLNGRTETLYSFTNSGGTFTTGAGTLIGTGATVTWSGGVNTVNNGGLVQDAHIVISGGVNTVEGGATGGTLQLDAAGTGLEMTGGVLALNSDNAVAGKLTLKGDVTTFASATSSEINNTLANTNPGKVDLDAGTRTFTVADGAAASDLYISARLQNGAVTKAGAGTLALQGDNTYAGATAVNAGALNIRSPNALGTTAGSTTVASGAALEMQGGFTSAAEALSLSGSGISNGGALRNVSGNNTFSGAVTLAGDTRISSDSGTLTLNSATALNGGGNNLSFGGAGNTTVSSVLSLGSGALTKVGAGTFTLSSNNSISGPTSVSAGTMRVSGKSNFTGNVSVASGATLDLNGGTTGVDNLTVSTGGTLEWGTGRLTHATSVGTDGTTLDDASSSGYQFVMPGKTAQVTGNIASDAGSILQMHGSGANLLYGDVVSGVRFNSVDVTGDLDLSAGGTLELNFNPFLLRPISPQGQAVYEWGSIPLVKVSGQLTGALTVTGILTHGFGFFQPSGIVNPTDGDDLALNTYQIEFDEVDDTIYLHYKIMGYVPEPGGFGLLFGGAAALRLLRRLGNSRRRITAVPAVSADTVSC